MAFIRIEVELDNIPKVRLGDAAFDADLPIEGTIVGVVYTDGLAVFTVELLECSVEVVR